MRKFKNTLLSHLDPDVIDRLSLRPVEFEAVHEIEFPGNRIDNLYFVEEGVASMTTTFQDGCQVEVSMFGYESVIGVSALMGTRRSLNRIYTQIPGWGYASPIQAATEEFARAGQFHGLALRYVQAQLVQTAQSVGCNARHALDQRLARWLLICSDRAHSQELDLSHEFISQMLGSTRASVSVAAAALRDHGVIDYTRRNISILNMAALEKHACECYHVIKQHLDNYAEFDTGYAA